VQRRAWREVLGFRPGKEASNVACDFNHATWDTWGARGSANCTILHGWSQ
jgi:hypothetical protein